MDADLENWTEEEEAAFIEWMKAAPERAKVLRRSVLPELPKIQIYARNPVLALLE